MYAYESKEYQKYLGVGQLCFLFGILTQRLIRHHFLDGIVRVDWICETLTYLFSFGAAVLLGLSIVLNIKALSMYRRQK